LPREATVVATSATKHYGTEAYSIYDPQIDIDVPTKVDKYTGKTRALRVGYLGIMMALGLPIRPGPICALLTIHLF